MRREGNFFALMFFVLGIGSMAAYFAVGWLSNALAMVRLKTWASGWARLSRLLTQDRD